MSYVESILQPNERILTLGRLHWIIYVPAAVCFIIGALLAGLSLVADGGMAMLLTVTGLVLIGAAVLLWIAAWFQQWITEIAVTNRRVIYKRGFIRRHTAEMNMDKVESVIVTQSILGRLLDYGSVHVRGTGEGLEHLHRIRAPLALRSQITAQ